MTHPCGAPVLVQISPDVTVEVGVLIITRCGLSVKKLQSHLMILGLTSITISFRIIRCGWMVLKAEEKSRKRSLA
ncbi:hypothetical protein ACOMHN_062456 [Nucella lapillus]